MKFIASAFLFSAVIASVSAAPLRLSRRAVDPALVPDLGLQAGLNPTGTGDCDGIPNAQGVPIKIPCTCPPDRETFINVSTLAFWRNYMLIYLLFIYIKSNFRP